MWSRVIVPCKLRTQFLIQLHEIHSYCMVWWPGLDCNTEQLAGCYAHYKWTCLAHPVTLTQSWEWPNKPLVGQHANFSGPVRGKMLTIVADVCTEWSEIHVNVFKHCWGWFASNFSHRNAHVEWPSHCTRVKIIWKQNAYFLAQFSATYVILYYHFV